MTRAAARLQKLSPGRTLSDISRATGLDLATVSRTFNKKRPPTWQTMTKIAAYLKVSLDDLQRTIQ